MSERHISVTRTDSDGHVSHTETHVEQSVAADGTVTTKTTHVTSERFDLSQCDELERAMIMYLRQRWHVQQAAQDVQEQLQQHAPQSLIERLSSVLDRCCCDDEEHQEHQA